MALAARAGKMQGQAGQRQARRAAVRDVARTGAAKTSGRTPWLPPALKASLLRALARLAGLGLIFLAAALLLALASYAPEDPSLNAAASDGAIQNMLGWSGAIIADLLWQGFGLAGFALPLALLVWGWHLLRRTALRRLWLKIPLFLVALPFLAVALLGLGQGTGFAPHAALEPAQMGGMVGHALHQEISAWLNPFLTGPGHLSAFLLAGLVGLLCYIPALGLSRGDYARGFFGIIALGRTVLARLRDGFFRLYDFCSDWLRPWIYALIEGRSGDASGHRRQSSVARQKPIVAAPKISAEEESRQRRALTIVQPKSKSAAGTRAKKEREPVFDLLQDGEGYQLPPLDLLTPPPAASERGRLSQSSLANNAEMLEQVLADYGIKGEIVKVRPGPVVTLYELEPAPGIKTSRVISLADDIARSMSAISVRVAVIPGKSVIGIELPNETREIVWMREILGSDSYEKTQAKLPLILGKEISGAPVIADLSKMPHLLIAGTTGSGKSVAVNTMITSLLYRLTPEQCRFIMIDPKMLELSVYDGIPHLLTPVVTEPGKAVMALKWVVQEMEERYRAMSRLGVRNVQGYNARLRDARKRGEVLTYRLQTGYDAETGKPVFEEHPIDLTELPLIVVIVDEFADLMMVAGKEIEACVQRLAQMARASGIHLIMATQRPSVDVITGTIKANFPTRISFAVTSKIDSRTILGEQGAEQLLGQGDMLYMAPGGRIERVHGPLVKDDEVETLVRWLAKQGEAHYNDSITEGSSEMSDVLAGMIEKNGGSITPEGGGGDELFDKAVDIVARERKASTSFLQRHLKIGYNRAAGIIDEMEAQGMISKANHVGKREVLLREPDEDAG